MRLPKVLAVAVASLLLAGGAAAASSLLARTGRGVALVVPAGARADVAGSASRGSSTISAVTPGAGGSPADGATVQGLLAPASGVPVSDPIDPAITSAAQAAVTTLPQPSSATLPSLPPLPSTIEPDALALLTGPLTASQAAAIRRLGGVGPVEVVDTGTVELGGAPVFTFGVDPSQFRVYTPAASASSAELWQYLEAGSLVSSYEMASDRRLQLGSTQMIAPAGSATPSVRGWLGAFAAIGLPGVDMLVDDAYSQELGLTPRSGLVVSAPALSGAALQSELEGALPGAAVELLHPDQVQSVLSGNSLSATQRQKLMAAALSRVGMPYAWGGAGPDAFDCSGLVQWAYRQAGILMPRTADEQFLTGVHLPLADAQPGDLLFWTYDPSDPGFVDHTAIYLGNDMMVVAPHTGLDVEVVPVPMSDFAGAVEVLLR